MLHGNPLLRGWWLSDVSFYTTELPEYMLVELARGLNPGVIHAVGAADVHRAARARGAAGQGPGHRDRRTRAGPDRGGIMLAPGPGFFSSPNHTGTQVPLLLSWLVIDRLGDRWYVPWLVGALLTWVEMADRLAIYVGALPVVVVSAHPPLSATWIMADRRGPAGGGGGFGRAGDGRTLLIRRAGGFVVAPTHVIFIAPAQLPHNLSLAAESVLTMFGADFVGLQPGLALAIALLQLTSVVLVAWACCIAARRLLAGDGRLVPILFVGITINLAAFALTTLAVDLGSAHELAAVLPFGAVLAGRLIPGRPVSHRAPSCVARGTGGLYRGACLPCHQAPRAADHAGRGIVADGQPPDGRNRRLLDGQRHDRRDQRPGSGTARRALLWPFLPGRLGIQGTHGMNHRADVSRACTHQCRRANGTVASAAAQFGAPVRTARIGPRGAGLESRPAARDHGRVRPAAARRGWQRSTSEASSSVTRPG